MTLNIFGQPIEGKTDAGFTQWISDRWPFRATIFLFASGTTSGTITSAGFPVYQVSESAKAPEDVALEIDLASKSIFGQASWYQQP